MSEVSQFQGITAAEMGAKVGLEPTITIGADKVPARFIGDTANVARAKEGVFDARMRGAIETPEDLAKINAKREAQNEALKFSGKEELKPLGVESLLQTVKDEEVTIIKGEKTADDNVRKFLGEPAKVETDGTETEAATGSMAKLDRMKGEAAATFAEIDEIVANVKGDSVTEVSTRVDAYNEFDQKHADDVVEMVQNATNVVLSSEGKSRAKYLKALGIDPNTFAEQLGADGMIDNVDVLSTQIADAIDVKAAAKHKKTGVSKWLSNQKLTSWLSPKENVAIDNIVDKAASFKQAEDMHKVEADTYGADFAKFDKAYAKFDKQLTRIANREKVNAEIGGAVEKGMQAESLKQQLEWRAEARKEHNDRSEASEKLVALNSTVEGLEKLAAEKAVVIEKTLATMGAIKKLDAEKAVAGAKLEAGNIPEKLGEIIGAKSFASVQEFINTNGAKGDMASVEIFLSEMEGLVAAKLPNPDGTPVVQAEFLSSNIVEIGGKQVEMGMVVGATTDPEVMQIVLASREPGTGDKNITLDNKNILFFPHAEVRRMMTDIKNLSESIETLERSASKSKGSVGVAGSADFGEQHSALAASKEALLNSRKESLAASKSLLAETIKPMGGKDATLAKALGQMGEAQQQIVDDLYKGAFKESVTEVAELLGVTPESVTPAMLAVSHVEAQRVADSSKEILNYLKNFNEIRSAAILSNKDQMVKFAKELQDLRESEAAIGKTPHPEVKAAMEKTIVKLRAKVDENAKKLAAQIEASLVESTPKVLRTDAKNISTELSSNTVAKRASELLDASGMSEYKGAVDKVVKNADIDGGLTQGLESSVVEIRNALSVLDLPISDNLRTAFKGGDPSAMERAVKEVIASELSAENDLRAEATRKAEAGKELGEMTGAELAKAFGAGDVNLDSIVSVVESSDGSSVDEFFDTMDDLTSTAEGKKSLVELNTRILELLLDHEKEGKALAELFNKNPENWSAMLRRLARDPGFNAAYLRNAIAVAEQVITEKKT